MMASAAEFNGEHVSAVEGADAPSSSAGGKARRLSIKPGAHVVLRDMEGSQKVFQLSGDKDLRMGKYHPIPIAAVLEVPYGATLRWTDGSWTRQRPIGVEDGDGDGESTEAALPTENNQFFKQDGSAQSLKPDDITQMKKNMSGEEVVATIAASSTTFASKTQFSKEKYLRKKQQKHVQQVTVLRPTVMELCETYLKSSRQKASGLRFDYLSSVMCHAHVHQGGHFMILDCTMGLVAGAMAQNMGGRGRIFRLYGSGCSDKALSELDLCAEDKALVSQVPLDVLASADPMSHEWAQLPPPLLPDDSSPATGSTAGAQVNGVSWRPEVHAARTQRALRRQAELQELVAAEEGKGGRGMDALVVVAGEDNKELLLAAESLEVGLKRLGAGGRLVWFGQHVQPLAAKQAAMKASGGWVDVRLLQLFTREFQVLPMRTHPHMTQEINHCEGFLLVGTKVMEANDIGLQEYNVEQQAVSEHDAKRQKLQA